MILSFFIKFLVISVYYGATRMWGVESTLLERTESEGVDYKNRVCEWSVHQGCSESAWIVALSFLEYVPFVEFVVGTDITNRPVIPRVMV